MRDYVAVLDVDLIGNQGVQIRHTRISAGCPRARSHRFSVVAEREVQRESKTSTLRPSTRTSSPSIGT